MNEALTWNKNAMFQRYLEFTRTVSALWGCIFFMYSK